MKLFKLLVRKKRERIKMLPDRILLSLRGTKQSKLFAFKEREGFTQN